MDTFHLFSILICISALFAYLNFRFLKLPGAIGLMIISLLFSLLVLAIGYFNPFVRDQASALFSKINFSELLLEIMLSFMLFAGAIHIKYEDLKNERLTIMAFATVSVVLSTFIVGYVTFYTLDVFGIHVQLLNALLFGALISPTDPIAVLSILKSSGISRSLQTKMSGESLFNDGVAVVIYLIILQLSGPGNEISLQSIARLFLQEAVGGFFLGIILGYLGYRLVLQIDNYQVEVLMTLAIVMGGYTLSHFIHVSGPLAMVTSGIIIGNHGKNFGMSAITTEYVDKFWELIDEILNAFLFVIIGLELLLIHTSQKIIFISLLLIVVTVLARYISLWIPSLAIRLKEKIQQRTLILLTWGGLRGGISIALALSIPSEMNKDLWVTITYVIVCFSILIQGLTIGKLARKMV